MVAEQSFLHVPLRPEYPLRPSVAVGGAGRRVVSLRRQPELASLSDVAVGTQAATAPEDRVREQRNASVTTQSTGGRRRRQEHQQADDERDDASEFHRDERTGHWTIATAAPPPNDRNPEKHALPKTR